MDRVVYQSGDVFPNGGWFAANLHVQIYRNFNGSMWLALR